MNGFLIANLLTLEAREAWPDLEQAFREDKVDLMVVGDWNEVRQRFGEEPTEEAFPTRKEAWKSLNCLSSRPLERCSFEWTG